MTTITSAVAIFAFCKKKKKEKNWRQWTYLSLKIEYFTSGGYKTFFMLNSAEHETFSANKYENVNNSWYFHIY